MHEDYILELLLWQMPPWNNMESISDAHFSGDDLIWKSNNFHRLARFGHSPQQAIFHSPVLIVQCDYLAPPAILRVKKMLLLNKWQKVIMLLILLRMLFSWFWWLKNMSHPGLGFMEYIFDLWKSYFSQRIHFKITIFSFQFTAAFNCSES